jgi:hypothetical protein
MLGRPILTPEMLEAHKAYVAGQNDAIWNPLYDYQAYPAAGQTELVFFAVQQGQGTTSAAGASGAKTEADTNMTNASLLPTNNEFYCTGVEVMFIPGVQPGVGSIALADFADSYANDVYSIGKSGVLTFRIQDRDYIQDSPLNLFPETTRLALATDFGFVFDADLATGIVERVSYANFSGEPYTITPVYIESNQAFRVKLNWPVAVATPSATIGRIGVRLNGYLIRAAQ